MVTGSGNITTETRPIGDWSAVALSCSGTLDLEIGENRGITIEADDNILPLIETYIDGGRLMIRLKPGLRTIKPTRSIQFRAATPAIDAMAVSGSGSIRAPRIDGSHLALDISGSGNIGVAAVSVGTLDTRISGSGGVTIHGDAPEHEIRISGSGRDLNARDLTSQHVRVNISGSGSAMIMVEREIEGRISGSGSIVYSGQPGISLRTSGSGRAVQMPG